MKCPNCGEEIAEKNKYCEFCGKKVKNNNGYPIELGIAGIILVIWGIISICYGMIWFTSVFFILAVGILKLVFVIRKHAEVSNIAIWLLSALLDILFCFLFLFFGYTMWNILFPILVMVEGLTVAAQSVDYKKTGFKYWWTMLPLGIASVALSIVDSPTFDGRVEYFEYFEVYLTFIGVITLGLAYIIAMFGEKQNS